MKQYTTVQEAKWLHQLRRLPGRPVGRTFLLILLLALLAAGAFAQNAIVGTGFAPGWGAACGTNTDFQYFTQGAGSSWIRITKPNGTGNQYFRLGVDWSGQLRQHTLTLGSDVKVDPNNEYTLNSNCTTTGSMFTEVANANHNYVFKTFNAGTTPAYRMVFFKVEGDIRSITNVSVPAAATAMSPVAITATLDGELSNGQAVYLRYSTDAFASSQVIAMTGSGTTYSANIPGLAAGNEVKYYCFTSGPGLGGVLNHANADFYTINLNSNGGLQYGYTVTAAPGIATIAPGNWSNPATWQGGVVPNMAGAHAIIRHTVTLDIDNAEVKNLTIEPAGTLNMEDKTLFISADGVVASTGTFNRGTSLLSFKGAGTLTGALQLHRVELTGTTDLGGSTVHSTLQLLAGTLPTVGKLTGTPPLYGPSGLLVVSTGTDLMAGPEFSPVLSPPSLRIEAGSTYRLANTDATATYTVPENTLVTANSTLIIDPLGNGNTAQPPAAAGTITYVTFGQFLQIDAGSKVEILAGDVGSVISGRRFMVQAANLINNGTLALSPDIGDDFVVKGHFENTGTFIPGVNSSAGTNPVTAQDGRAVYFNGSFQQEIRGLATDFHYLIVDNPAGLLCKTNVLVSRGLNLQNGKIDLDGKTLSIGKFHSGTDAQMYILGRVYGGSPNSYVYGGPVVRYISNKNQPTTDDEQVAPNLNQPILFPVGTLDNYRPFTVTYTAYPTVAGTLQVSHTAGAGVAGGTAPNLTDTDGLTITEAYTDAYWTATPTAATNGTFSVSYTCTNCNIGDSNPDKIRAMRRTTGADAWTLPGAIVATTGNNVSPTVGRSGLTGFSQYGIGYNPVVLLPVRLRAFAGVSTPQGNVLNWISSSEVNFSHYSIERSDDGRRFAAIGRVAGRGGSADAHYTFTDAQAAGTQYYRLHMVDKDGTGSYSAVVKLSSSKALQGVQVQYVAAAQSIWLQHPGNGFAPGAQLRLTDANGRVILHQKLQAQRLQYVAAPGLAVGVYFVSVVEKTGAQSTYRVLVSR